MKADDDDSGASSAHSNEKKSNYFAGVSLNDILFSSRSRKKPDYFLTNYEQNKRRKKKFAGRSGKRNIDHIQDLPAKSRNTKQEVRSDTDKSCDDDGNGSSSLSAVCKEGNDASLFGKHRVSDDVKSHEDLAWDKNFKHLKDLHDTNDPAEGIIFIEYSPLSSWIVRQREGMKMRERGKCTWLKNRGIALLDSIHFDWGYSIRHKKSNKWKYHICDDIKKAHEMWSQKGCRKQALLNDNETSLVDEFIDDDIDSEYPSSMTMSKDEVEPNQVDISRQDKKRHVKGKSNSKLTRGVGGNDNMKGKVKGKQLSYLWACNKCKKAKFATFEEACKHEHFCKGPKGFRWLCARCESVEFNSFEECTKHENKCTGLMCEGRGTWLCGFCKAAKFLSYADACAHEACCKSNVSVAS
uniref:Uncharacterized protein n=1 Tax=Leptocylindrus danicus TaxID=163516 RepID=A0A7S2K0Q6_9STRA|mmetsp:Transcript_14245/g.21064  ORF Transcript_14245/g.21064 Transcript_14245/m.21064 type:complete len:410 (+) Transcript_14245:50-1279(+)